MKYLIGMMALAAATVFAGDTPDPSTTDDPVTGPFLLDNGRGSMARAGDQVEEIDLSAFDFHPVRYEWLLDFPSRFSSFPATGFLLFLR